MRNYQKRKIVFPIVFFFLIITYFTFNTAIRKNNRSISHPSSHFRLFGLQEQHDLCIISFWEGEKLSHYHSIFLTSANSTRAKVFFFYEGDFENLLANFTHNMESIRIPDMTTFFAEKICIEVFHESHIDTDNCKQLKRVLFEAKEAGKGSVLAQLRVFAQEIFAEWVSPRNCKSWATIDNDVILGDVLKFIQGNELYWSSNLVTFYHRDFYKIYSRGPFTAQIYSDKPPLWKYCPHVNDITRLLNTFDTDDFFGLDEGCFAYAAANHDFVFTMFPYLSDGWGYRVTAALEEGHYYMSYEQNEEFVPKNSERSLTVPKLVQDQLFVNKSIEFSEDKSCIWWVHDEYKMCLPPSNRTNDVYRLGNGKVWAVTQAISEDENYEEYALFHINILKKYLIIEESLGEKLYRETPRKITIKYVDPRYQLPESIEPFRNQLEATPDSVSFILY